MYLRQQFADSPAMGLYLFPPRRRRRAGMSGITPAQAVQQAVASEANVNPADAQGWLSPTNPTWTSGAYSLESAQVYLDTVCQGQPAPKLNLYKIGGALVLSTATTKVGAQAIASVASHLIPGITSGIVAGVALGVGAVVTIFSIIHAHHKAAVQRDIAAECSLVPAVNNAFQVIIQGVQNGTLTPQQGIDALAPIPDQFSAAAGPAKNNHPFCNSVCEKLITVKAIVYYWTEKFRDMIATPSAAPSAAVTSQVQQLQQQAAAAQAAGNPTQANALLAQAANLQASASIGIGIPTWAIWAAGGLLVWKLIN
jgi:hypothetical protein